MQLTQRDGCPIRSQIEKCMLAGGGRLMQDQHTLAKIVEQERGQDHSKPRKSDRPFAEVSHVRVQWRVTAYAGTRS
jgi:hypothetical protein